MKAITVLLVACAACGEDVDMFPINPGGGGGGGTTFADAAVDAPVTGDGGLVSGRVCLIDDARTPTACAASGAENLTVMLGTQTAMTMTDGTFSIARTGTNLTWRVSGPGIIASAQPTSSGTTIPALTLNVYESMITSSSAVSGNNTGALIVKLTQNGLAVSGATATTNPAPQGNVYYDDTSIDQWAQDQTGSFGVVWVPGLDPGTVSMQVGNATLTGIPVFSNTITYLFAEL